MSRSDYYVMHEQILIQLRNRDRDRCRWCDERFHCGDYVRRTSRSIYHAECFRGLLH